MKNEWPGAHCMCFNAHALYSPNLGNPVISVNCGSFLQPENEASLDARLLTLRVAEAIGQARGRFTQLSRLRDYKP